MNVDPARHALRRRPLFTPLYAGVALLVVGVVVLGWLAAGVWQTPSTVVVVRHFEKALDGGDDPALSDAGRARAERLAEAFASAGVEAVYASQFRRTAETAMPLAARLSLPLQIYDAREGDALIARLRDQHRGGTAFVVGHSNTVPAIVEALSGEKVGELAEDRYGDVFVVVRPRWGTATVTRLYIK